MPSLSERLEARMKLLPRTPEYFAEEYAMLESAASVCALVEAFQAADQALAEAVAAGAAVSVRAELYHAVRVTKARLLEVDLT